MESCPPALLLSVKQAALLHLPVDSNTVRWYFFKEKNRLLTSSSASITLFPPRHNNIISFLQTPPFVAEIISPLFFFSTTPLFQARTLERAGRVVFLRLSSFALFYLSGVLRACARVSFSFGKIFGVRRQRDPILLSHVLTNERN